MGSEESVLQMASARWQPAQLQAAFAEFEQTSQHLANFYANLEGRVAELTAALGQSHQALQAELAEKERLATRLSVLLEALPGGVVGLDAQGKVREFNPAASDLLGPMRCGEPWIDVVARAFAPRLDDGHDISVQDGRRVNVATAALPHEPGQILLIKDVTETRHLQEQLNHHRRLSAKTELAAVLAHQIRTPLAAALLQLGNLNRPNIDLALQQRARPRALDSIRQIEHLVNDMLSFARGTVVDPQPLSVAVLLQDVSRTHAAAAGEETFVLKFGEPDAALHTLGNRNALVSILLNLINNAREAQQSAGECLISAAEIGGHLEIRVTDRGAGIPPALQSQIFEPFFTTRTQGTGLGLSAARAVARAHGGDLSLDPTAETGASFVLTLPSLTAQSSARTPEIPEETLS